MDVVVRLAWIRRAQDEQKGEKEKHDDDSKNNILAKEIDSE
jgi:hypothetical protein